MGLANCRIWLRASTSSPTRFISWSSRPTSTRMVRSLALCPRRPAAGCSASTTSAGRAAPCSTRISPRWRGSPSLLVGRAQDLRRRRRRPAASECRPSMICRATARRPLRKRSPAPAQARSCGVSAAARFREPAAGRSTWKSARCRRVRPRRPGLDARQHLTDGVHHRQQAARDFSIQLNWPSRNRPSRLSPTCATAPSLSKARKPDVPLMV